MILVEDGTNVAGANSYVADYELREYAEQRGVELPQSDEAVEALLHRAMDYLDTLTHRMAGFPTFSDQPLPWPRSVYLPGRFSPIGIPDAIRKAQMIAALAAIDGPLVGATSLTASATRKTVGPITVEYPEGSVTPVAYVPQVMAVLRPYLAATGQPDVVRA